MNKTLQKNLLVFAFYSIGITSGFGQSIEVYTAETDMTVSNTAGRSVILFNELTTTPGHGCVITVNGELTLSLPTTHTTQCDPSQPYTPVITSSLSLTAPLDAAPVLANTAISIENHAGTTLADYNALNRQPISFQHQFTLAAGSSKKMLQIGIENRSKLTCKDKKGNAIDISVNIIVHKSTEVVMRTDK